MYNEKGEVKVEITTISPLLHDNPFDIVAGVKGKTPTKGAVQKYDPRQLYWMVNNKPYINPNDPYPPKGGIICQPTDHIKGAMVNAAGKVKIGRASAKQYIKAMVFMRNKLVSLDKDKYDFIEPGVVRDKLGNCKYTEKPGFFTGLKIAFVLGVTFDVLLPEKVQEVLEIAGSMYGIGARRPDFGRFAVSSFIVS